MASAVRPTIEEGASLVLRYQGALRRLRLKRLLPWAPFQFGARWHGFGNEPPAASEALSEFERRWDIQLPEPYRGLLATVGDGFAGPYYGIAPLGEWCAPAEQSELASDVLRTPFAPDAARVAGVAPGALRVCNVGCEHYHLLIVSGPHRGEIWHDGGVDNMGIFRLEAPGTDGSFQSWLSAWLAWVAEPSERQLVPDAFWHKARFPGHAVARVVADGVAAAAADQLPCLVCVRLLLNRGVKRLVVPAIAGQGRQNPMRVARAAAQELCRATPRIVYP